MNDLITRRAAVARVAYLLGGALSASTVAGVLAGCERKGSGAAEAASVLGERKEMVAVMAEHILPETDTPGARAAGVHDFIDVMLADYYPAEERDRFLTGLARVDARAQRAFGKPFVEATADQQLQLVRALNRQAFADPAARATSPDQEPVTQPTTVETGRSGPEQATASLAVTLDSDWDPEDVGRQSFFRTFKELVLVGYYTSEVGGTTELKPNPMGAWRADIPFSSVGQAWSN